MKDQISWSKSMKWRKNNLFCSTNTHWSDVSLCILDKSRSSTCSRSSSFVDDRRRRLRNKRCIRQCSRFFSADWKISLEQMTSIEKTTHQLRRIKISWKRKNRKSERFWSLFRNESERREWLRMRVIDDSKRSVELIVRLKRISQIEIRELFKRESIEIREKRIMMNVVAWMTRTWLTRRAQTSFIFSNWSK